MNEWKCKRCGICCKYVAFPLPPVSEDTIRYINAHRNMMVVDGFLVVKSRCKHLKYKNGKHYCAIHENKPKICREGGKVKKTRSERFKCCGSMWDTIDNLVGKAAEEKEEKEEIKEVEEVDKAEKVLPERKKPKQDNLVCPQCKGDLWYLPDANLYYCDNCDEYYELD